jgi:hypothetical protein
MSVPLAKQDEPVAPVAPLCAPEDAPLGLPGNLRVPFLPSFERFGNDRFTSDCARCAPVGTPATPATAHRGRRVRA